MISVASVDLRTSTVYSRYKILDTNRQLGFPLTFSRLTRYIYMSYRTANLQMLHFIYLFNKYTY